MPGIGLGISIAKAGGGTPPTAAQIVGDFNTRAGLADATITTALTTFVAALKTAGVWDKYTAIYPFVGGTASAHSQNLVSSAFPITWNGALSHDVMGSRSDGGYGNTGININTLTLTDFSFQAYVNYADATPGTFVGAHDGGDAMYQLAATSSLLYGDCHTMSSGRLTTGVATPPGGFCMVSRKSGTAAALWMGSGIQNTYGVAPPNGIPSFNGNLYVLSLNYIGIGATNPVRYPLKFVAIAKSIPDASGVAVSTAVVNLQTTLGRVNDTDFYNYTTAVPLTDGRQISAVMQVISSLKSSGIWSNAFSFYPYLGGTAAYHSQNLKGTYPITWVNAPVHNIAGTTGNGTSSYGTVTLQPANMTVNGGMSVYLAKIPVGDGNKSCGVDNAVDRIYDIVHDVTGGSSYFRYGATLQAFASIPVTPGFFSGSRTGPNALDFYKNGVLQGSNTNNSPVSALASPLLLFASNGPAFLSEETQSFASFHFGLTAGQTATFNTIVQTFQTNLNRIDSDVVSFAARANLATQAHLDAIHTLVTGLKAQNLWTKMSAIYPMVGGTAASHAQNLKSSSYTITWGNAPTHSAAGVASTGSAYGDTGFLINNLSPTDVHLAAYYTGTSGAGDLLGVYDGSAYVLEMECAVGALAGYTFDCNNLADGRMIGTTDGRALNIVTRTSISAAAAYVRGVNQGSKLTTVSAMTMPAINCYILSRNSNVGPQGGMPVGCFCSFASIGTSLTAADALALHNLVQAYQTTLGRAV